VPTFTPIVNAPSGRDPIHVTHVRHPKRRFGSAELHFARIEKCGAAINSIDFSGLHVHDALKVLSSTHVLLSNLGSALTWTVFMFPTAVAWAIIPGYLKPLSSVARTWVGETSSSASVGLWRSRVADELARVCFQCVGAQLGGISFVVQFPVNVSFTLDIDGPPAAHSGSPELLPLVYYHGYSPIVNVTKNDFDLGWAVARRLLRQHLEVHDREVLIHGLSAPSWTDSAVLSDEVRAYIWPKLPPNTETLGTEIRVQQGSVPVDSELCATAEVLEAHRPSS
jgi:hypothetical protein